MKGIQALYGPPVSNKDFPEDLEDKQNDEEYASKGILKCETSQNNEEISKEQDEVTTQS